MTRLILSVVFILLQSGLWRTPPTSSFTTTFPSTENPLSMGGLWMNGLQAALDWQNCTMTPGYAGGTGHVSSGPPCTGGQCDDPTCILRGNWGANQTITAVVKQANEQTTNIFEEVELRFRMTVGPHSITGYEYDFRCAKTAPYAGLVRWNGALNDFTAFTGPASPPGLADGDTIVGSISGNTVTIKINGSTIDTVDITSIGGTTYSTGNPGMGFFLNGSSSLASMYPDFGFKSVTITSP